MSASRKFCQRASQFYYFILVDEGIEDPNIAINGPLSTDDGPTLNAGLVAL